MGRVHSSVPAEPQGGLTVLVGLYGYFYEVRTPVTVTALKPLSGSAPGTELSTSPFFSFAEKRVIHRHALRHGPPELYSYTARYNAVYYTAVRHSVHRYTLYNLYNTPL